jgi:hypothetical protein
MTSTPVGNRFPLVGEQRRAYDRDGFVVMRSLLPAGVLDAVRGVVQGHVERLARAWYDAGLLRDVCDNAPFEKRYAALRRQLPARLPTGWHRALVSRPIYELWQRPELLGPVRSLVGDEVYAYGVWNVRPQEPRNPIQDIYWHQGIQEYQCCDPAAGPLVEAWIPLVPVDERSGCLQFVPGSHRWGRIERHRHDGLGIRYDDAQGTWRSSTPFTAVMEPGDVIFFYDTVLRQSLDNISDYVRWSIDLRFGTATNQMIRNSPSGYYCFSGSDNRNVESYEVWASRYECRLYNTRGGTIDAQIRGELSLA